METLTRLNARRTLLALIAAAVLTPLAGHAAPLNARVIWSHGDRAYLVARDSVWVIAGSSLRFLYKKKEIASGVVVDIGDTTLLVARITSGSLERVKHLDRLQVEAERGSPRARTSLRVGYPSSARVQPFFECRRMTLDPHDYARVDTTEGLEKLIGPRGKNLPDTLVVREFHDAADEEIALERGEIDAAIFWPGEPSAHIREAMQWSGVPNPIRARGAVGVRPNSKLASSAIVMGRLSKGTVEALARLDTDLFRGDLPRIEYAEDDSTASWSFEIDPKLPGRDRIARALAPSARPAGADVILTYFDTPTQPTSDTQVVDEPQLWLFLVGCPVISRPELRPYLESIDLTAIVNLFDCETASRKP